MRFAGAKLWQKKCNRVANMPLIRKYDVPTFLHNTSAEAGDAHVPGFRKLTLLDYNSFSIIYI